jgi:hypothetical protein
MKVLKFCVVNIKHSSLTLKITNYAPTNPNLVHLTMRSWLDRDKDNINQYSFNAVMYY